MMTFRDLTKVIWMLVMAGVGTTQLGPLKAADVPFISHQGPHSFQDPPTHYLSLIYSTLAWFFIQIVASA